MRLRLFVIFLSAFALILSCAAPSGASVKAKGSVGKKAISKALGGAKVNFALMATASGTGEIFMLTRDAASKTRDLGWALYDPSSNKVLARGKCPFEHENKMVAVSPNARYAAAFSRFPTALNVLDLKTGEWHEAYRNPAADKEGLAIQQFVKAYSDSDSPLTFIDDDTVASVLRDMVIREGKKEQRDLVPVFYKVSGKRLDRGMSFSKCLTAAEKAVRDSGAAVDGRLTCGKMEFAGIDRYALVLSCGSKRFLVECGKGGASVVDSVSGAALKFKGFRGSDGALAYLVIKSDGQKKGSAPSAELRIAKSKDVKVVDSGRIVDCLVPDDGRIFVMIVSDSGRMAEVCLVKGKGDHEKIVSTQKVASLSFGAKANVIYLISDEVQWVKII